MNRYILLLAFFVFFQNAFANIALNYCTATPTTSIIERKCNDKILVGSAQIFRNAIAWTGSQSVSLFTISGGGNGFGITGAFQQLSGQPSNNFTYRTSEISSKENSWIYVSTTESYLTDGKSGNDSPSTGLFFAPVQSGLATANFKYVSFITDGAVRGIDELVTGEGVADTNHALTLDVQPVTTANTTTFTITPKLDVTKLPAGVQPPKYAFVQVEVTEQDNGCLPAQYSEIIQTPQDFSENNYYHSLSGENSTTGQLPQGTCQRYYQFLATIDKSFTLTAQKSGTRNTGFVKYDFFLRGHYSSAQTRRLDNATTPVEATHQLKVTTQGTGSVSSLTPPRDSVPCAKTANETNCSDYTYKLGDIVTLEATVTPNSTLSWVGSCAQDVAEKTKATVQLNDVKEQYICTAIFSPVSESKPEEVTLTVKIVDETGKETVVGGNVKSSDKTIDCPTRIPCEATRPKSDTDSIKLTPIPSNGYQFGSWSENCQVGQENDGSITLLWNESRICMAMFSKITELKAVLPEPVVAWHPTDSSKIIVTLDASQSTPRADISSYQIQIYNQQQLSEPISLYPAAPNFSVATDLLANNSHAIFLIVRNNSGKVDIATRTHPPSLPAPVGLTAVPNAERVTLTAQVGNLSGLTYRWLCHECYWKNRNTGIIEETTGTLRDEGLASGTYIIKLLVLNSDKKIIGSAAKVVTIQPNSPPVANFTVTPQEVALSNSPEIKLDATTSSDPDGGNLTAYQWVTDPSKGTLEADPTDQTNSAKQIFKPILPDTTATGNTLNFTFSLKVTDDDVPAETVQSANSVLQVTPPKAQFTVTQENLLITLDSQSSVGAVFSPTTQEPNRITLYNWKWDEKPHYFGSGEQVTRMGFNAEQQGIHKISLEITDSYGYTGKTEREVLIAPKTIPGTALNAQGGSVSTSSKFSALLPNSTVAVAQQLEIPISFQIDAEDVGKAIDLLLVVGIEPPKAQYTGGVETNYYAMVPENVSCTPGLFGYCPVNLYAKSDVWMAQLTEPYKRGVVAESNMVRTLTRSFSAPGMHYIFAGYHRPDNVIVYSAQPVAQFEVK
jgi:hypothetical protein